ncbi:MAG TPA: type IX secretion system membrane protein PorP/SprF [Flavobacteriales bacterium]|nr:type IX secretion system membrane protein PorP/SprF [Flavobacteriales bacterium]
MNGKRTRTTLSGLLAAITLTAQDAQFSQFYALPTYVSPAFAGTGLQTRVGLAVRDQWPAFPGAFVSASFALDHYMPSVNSGVGLLVSHDKAGSGALRYSSISGQYAYEIELKRKVFLRPALQIGWANHAVDYSKLVFGDQLARGGTVGTCEYLNGASINYADFGGGLLYFTPKYWAGMSFHHLNRPNQSLLGNEARMPVKFSMHGGWRTTFRTPIIKEHPQSLVLAFNYRAQEKYDQLDVGGYFERDPFYAGLWYRGIPLLKRYAPGYSNRDALVILGGVIVNDLRIGYSYDLTLSRLAGHSGGAHEITLGYEMASRSKKRSMSKRRVVPCAKF